MPPRNIVIGQKVSPELAQRARELRSNQTPAEQVLWEKLRGNRPNGWHFRRQ
jgi:very-short-patch-repair endonuclease